jgi:DNA-binding MarR family transcriptional regulator
VHRLNDEVVMETKEDMLKAVSLTLMRIMAKHARIEEISVRLEEGVDLTPKEMHTIQAIGERENVNVTDLASCCGVTKSASSQMAAKLARNGFLEKSRAGHSNKEWQLSLTELGWRAFHAHERIHERHFADLAKRLDSFSLSQIATVSVVLEVMEGVVEERLSQLSERNFFWDDGTGD